jgi:fructose-1,6-bisphosphatase II
MEKLAVGPDVPPQRVSLNFTVKRNLDEVARALQKPVTDVTVIILDRPRHMELVQQVRPLSQEWLDLILVHMVFQLPNT